MNIIDTQYQADSELNDKLISQFPIKLISSKVLFGIGNEILIQHRGEQYHLRLTRNDKLILTK
ncbi:Hemin uptake protein HemP [Nitrosomonas eutropha]|uniref:Hemin uptake protein HemP n=1 Tax=Nitrosomonas eutropha TaxID=916 RepID=A0A1I7GB56_9PROT|nr:hemin uptake protein HemP [Nitrosomonas eutropha]SFU45655.1 Hemin uptake protein HemP [Nitrosomonas eutropha]